MEVSEKGILLQKISSLRTSLIAYEGIGAGVSWDNYVLSYLHKYKVSQLGDLDASVLHLLIKGLEELTLSYTNQA